jgi:hypothetical protein
MAEISVDTSSFENMLIRVAENLGTPVEAQVVTNSSAARKYWPVLEHGSGRGRRPWPNPRKKTMLGTDGRVYSKQAPDGFVHKHYTKFVDFLKRAYLRRVSAKQAPLTREEMEAAADEATWQAERLIHAGAPRDSGEFADSITAEKAK